LGEALEQGTALVEDLVCLEGPALEEAVWPMGPGAEVDQECLGHILCV
jgi:hypothetical protein